MNPRINQLVRTLLQKESLEQCSLQELQQFADRHPYFGAAQLLLTKKLQTEDPASYNEQLQKTFLFFNNPLWVQQLLNGNGEAQIIPAKKNDTAAGVTTQELPAATVRDEEPVVVTEIKTETPEILKPVEEESPPPTLTIKTEPAQEPTGGLIFEPYHTVDYFASQGIKAREEAQPQDKFGKQLKSFTEWLKTMKRIPVGDLSMKTEPVSEKKVEELAEFSLKDGEVITEAMAEVWQKQGNPEKAIGIYRKLSLLEPSKSAYFAAKIEAIKKTD